MDNEPSIFRRMRNSEPISRDDPEFGLVDARYNFLADTLPKLNACVDLDSRRKIFAEVFGKPLDPTSKICTPFFTDWGLFTTIGRNTFVNGNCTFLDQGGIELGEGVLIGPNVMLITTNHPLEPDRRTEMVHEKIVIEDNVWIGAGTTVLPGVRIGRNSVIGAGSLVTKDIPPNVLAMGRPAVKYKDL